MSVETTGTMNADALDRLIEAAEFRGWNERVELEASRLEKRADDCTEKAKALRSAAMPEMAQALESAATNLRLDAVGLRSEKRVASKYPASADRALNTSDGATRDYDVLDAVRTVLSGGQTAAESESDDDFEGESSTDHIRSAERKEQQRQLITAVLDPNAARHVRSRRWVAGHPAATALNHALTVLAAAPHRASRGASA